MKLKRFLTFCCNRCILTEGGTDKNHPGQTFQTKDPLTKAPDKSPREQLRQNLYRRLLSGFFVLSLVKIRGAGQGCVTYFLGGPGMCDKVSHIPGPPKLAKSSVTYFMDSPYPDERLWKGYG